MKNTKKTTKSTKKVKHYAVRIFCENCHLSQRIKVPKGVRAFNFAQGIKCPNCETNAGWQVSSNYCTPEE